MLRTEAVQLGLVQATMVWQSAMLVVLYASNYCLSNDYISVRTVANVIPST